MNPPQDKKFMEEKQITNGEVIFGMILSCIAGLTWGYLHWGLNIPW